MLANALGLFSLKKLTGRDILIVVVAGVVPLVLAILALYQHYHESYSAYKIIAKDNVRRSQDESLARKAEREEYGLQAQEKAAFWAFWSVVVSGLGTMLLLLTLNENRKSVLEIRRENELGHPPRFKITRPIIFDYCHDEMSEPDFGPQKRIGGRAFAINYGRYDATINVDSSGNPEVDCYFFWTRRRSVPMWEAYQRGRDTKAWARPSETPEKFPLVEPGEFFSWKIEGKVPIDFKVYNDGNWNYELYLVGRILYTGAAEDRRGLYFYKRYLPKDQRFENAEEYENED